MEGVLFILPCFGDGVAEYCILFIFLSKSLIIIIDSFLPSFSPSFLLFLFLLRISCKMLFFFGNKGEGKMLKRVEISTKILKNSSTINAVPYNLINNLFFPSFSFLPFLSCLFLSFFSYQFHLSRFSRFEPIGGV